MKVIPTDYSACKSSRKMIQEQAAAAVTIALISEKNKSRKNRKKRVGVKPGLRRRKNLEFYKTLLAELRLEYECYYSILLRMTSENFVKIFQLIKGHIGFLSTRELYYKSYVYEYYHFYSTMNSSTFPSFHALSQTS